MPIGQVMIEPTLYMYPGSCSRVTMVALEEVGLDYALRPINLAAGEQKSGDYLAVNERGKVPALTVDGKTLTENVAILTYLASRYPEAGLLPKSNDPLAHATVLSDLSWCATTLHPAVRQIRNPRRWTVGEDLAGIRDDGQAKIAESLALISARLSQREWWYGDRWSIIDAYLHWVYSTAAVDDGKLLEGHIGLLLHGARVQDRSAFGSALAKERAIAEHLGVSVHDPRKRALPEIGSTVSGLTGVDRTTAATAVRSTDVPTTCRKSLLVGSVPLETAEAVFSAVAQGMGEHLDSLPDGETGPRSNWIAWQHDVIRQAPFLSPARRDGQYGSINKPMFEVSRYLTKDDAFGSLGYADSAIASYAVFSHLRATGVIAPHLRFQVSLPTPLAPMTFFIVPEDLLLIEPLYKAAMRKELFRICEAIPVGDLAIQWDTALEFALLEGVFPGPVKDGAAIMSRLVEIASWVPHDIPMGFHFCYGDAGHRHFKEPDDAGLMVEVANQLSAASPRPLSWIHLPVPRDRSDDRYFAPLANLALSEHCDLFLGLIHLSDGEAGASRRIAAAARYAPAFGVATECGWGRRPAADIPSLLKLSSVVARAKTAT